MLLCPPCRLSYLNGYQEGFYKGGKAVGRSANDPHLCPACGHFDHEDTPCGWHGGNCDEALTDPTLWCRCDSEHPLGRDIEPRPKCWSRVTYEAANRKTE